MTGRTRIPGPTSRFRRWGSLEGVSNAVDLLQNTAADIGRIPGWDGTQWTAVGSFGSNKVMKTAPTTSQLVAVTLAAGELLGIRSGGTQPTSVSRTDLVDIHSVSSFPSVKTNLRVYHTGLKGRFVGDEDTGGWWGEDEYHIVRAAGVENVAANVYLKIPMDVASRYSSTIGDGPHWNCKPVLASFDIVNSSTGTIELVDDGVGVSNGTLTWTAQSGIKTKGRTNFTAAGTVLAGSTLGLRVQNNVGESIQGGYLGFFMLQRFET